MNPKFQGAQHDKRRYIRLTSNGTTVICEPHEVQGIVDDGSEYTTSEVWMSPAEYEALPELQGF
jgi:hypothetical protein